jgi:hypothetical protein
LPPGRSYEQTCPDGRDLDRARNVVVRDRSDARAGIEAGTAGGSRASFEAASGSSNRAEDGCPGCRGSG